jgi:hypothetical protein
MRERTGIARGLRFRFHGFIALADRQELLQGLNDWLHPQTHMTEDLQQQQEIAEEKNLQRLGMRLSAVFHALFQPDTEDRVNLTRHAWTQIVFQITLLQPEIAVYRAYVRRQGVRHARLLAASADGLHRISLMFTHFPVGGPYASVNIQYVGPQRFRTFNDYNHHQARGGDLEEMRGDLPPPAVGRPLNDTGVFEGWRRRENVQ